MEASSREFARMHNEHLDPDRHDPALQQMEPFATFQPGYVAAMAPDFYRAVEAMSASGAKVMLRSPQHYYLARSTIGTPTAQMLFGSAVHYGVLEPDIFPQRVIVAPDVNRRSNAGRDELAAFNAANVGKIILSGEDFLRCIECVNAVRAHPAAAKLLDGGEREGSMFWKDGQFNVPCKARFDAMNRGGLIDLKTTVNAAPEEWGKQAANLLYHLQAAHYMNGAEAALNATPEFFAFVCVESDAPYAVACYVLPGAAISAGRVLCNIALERYAQALQAGVWPGYSPTIDVVPFPKWALRF